MERKMTLRQDCGPCSGDPVRNAVGTMCPKKSLGRGKRPVTLGVADHHSIRRVRMQACLTGGLGDFSSSILCNIRSQLGLPVGSYTFWLKNHKPDLKFPYITLHFLPWCFSRPESEKCKYVKSQLVVPVGKMTSAEPNSSHTGELPPGGGERGTRIIGNAPENPRAPDLPTASDVPAIAPTSLPGHRDKVPAPQCPAAPGGARPGTWRQIAPIAPIEQHLFMYNVFFE